MQLPIQPSVLRADENLNHRLSSVCLQEAMPCLAYTSMIGEEENKQPCAAYLVFPLDYVVVCFQRNK